ncbi:MAG: hypothetical protein LKJ76_02060 [Lachnospiraceae bacterium]|nr:hypothetical protein [Lachnospiraceae bacterium]
MDRNRLRRERRRREAQIRRHVALLGFAAAVIISLSVFLASGIRSNAAGTDTDTEYKYYTSVTIAYGENVYDVAERYYSADHYDSMKEYLREVADINGMPGTGSEDMEVRPGNSLIVPYYSDIYKD